ncbi:NifB/NifX family molybdenum-iron cluster-binding protein [Vibrio vulnificus]
MIAIPLHQDKISGHFMKAERFALINSLGEVVAYLANPAFNQAKARCVQQLLAAGVTQLMVKNIGQKSLAKLLSKGVAVYQLAGRCSLHEVSKAVKTPMTSATQGRECRSHSQCGSACRQQSKVATREPNQRVCSPILRIRPRG